MNDQLESSLQYTFNRVFCGNRQEHIVVISIKDKTTLFANANRMQMRLGVVRDVTRCYFRLNKNEKDTYRNMDAVMDLTSFGKITNCSIKGVGGIFCRSDGKEKQFLLAERKPFFAVFFPINQRLQHELAHVQQEQCSGVVERQANGELCRADFIAMEAIAIIFGSFWSCIGVMSFLVIFYITICFVGFKFGFPGMSDRIDSNMLLAFGGLVAFCFLVVLCFVLSISYYLVFHGRPCKFSGTN